MIEDCDICADKDEIVCLDNRRDMADGERKWYSECPCPCHSTVVYWSTQD